MKENMEFEFKFPNDDGMRQRAWIVDGDERGKTACERVMRVLQARPWIKDVVETPRDTEDVDVYFKMNDRLVSLLKMWEIGQPIPVQVKSSESHQRLFSVEHRNKMFNVKKRKHIFVLDGQDAMDVITADLVGQMIVLACMLGTFSEKGLLRYMETEMRDHDIVARYRENRELLLEAKWYGEVILEAGKGKFKK